MTKKLTDLPKEELYGDQPGEPVPDFASLTETAPAPAQEAAPESYNQFTQLLSALIDGMKGIAMTPEALKDILSENAKVSAELSRKARWPENANHPGISCYSYPEGDVLRAKPKLTRETFFCGVREDEERLTPGEILAFNALDKPSEVRNGAWRAVIRKPTAVGAREELHVYVPKETVDQRMGLPSLHLILHELGGGPSSQDVMSLIKQIEGLKAKLLAKGTTAQELEDALLAAAAG